MAQKTDIRLRRSDTAGKIPTSANLSDGELAINTNSGALYFKKSDDTIITVHDNTILHIDSDTTGSNETGSNPKVGIGTTSPSELLHIYNTGGAGNDANVLIEADGPGVNAKLTIDGHASGGQLDLTYRSDTQSKTVAMKCLNDGSFRIDTLGSEAMRIVGDNVGIGTDSPNNKLQVVGAADGINIVGTNSYLRWNSGDMMIRNEGSYAMGFHTYNGSSAMVEHMRITSAGNVGIGTNAPARKLHVESDGQLVVAKFESGNNAGALIDIENDATLASNAGAYAGLRFYNDSGFEMALTHITESSGNGYVQIGTAWASGGEKLVVHSNGNVGIGTIDPQRKLEVVDNILIAGSSGANLYFRPNTSYSTAGNFGIFTTGLSSGTYESTMTIKGYGSGVNDVMTIKGLGNVGIGTTTPSELLEVAGDAKVTNLGVNAGPQDYLSSLSARLVVGGNAVINNNSPILYLRANSSSNNSDLRFQYGLKFTNGAGAIQAIIDSAGNVGIGTSSPQGTLHLRDTTARLYVQSNDGSSAHVTFGDATDVTRGGIEYTSTDDLVFSNNNFAERMRIRYTGAIGIGTSSPNRKLHISDSGGTVGVKIEATDGSQASVDLTNTEGAVRLINDGGAFQIYDDTDTAQRFHISTAGAITFNNAFTFPTSIGSAGQVLKVPNSGTTLQWADETGGGGSTDSITDADGDTKIQVEETADEDVIRFDVAGSEIGTMTDDGVILNDGYNFEGGLIGCIKFKAQAGEALTIGDVVYISGISGNTVIVSKADANDPSKMPAFGLAGSTVSLNAAVPIVTFGTLQGVDTSTPSFALGEELYVSTTAGALTNSAPTGSSSLIQKIGKVTRVDASAGSIKVQGAGRTNATPNLDEGRLFVGNSSNQSVQGDDTLYVDMANSRVGINTTNPSYKLHVGGSSGKSYLSGGIQLDSTNRIDFGNGNQYITGANDTSLTLATGGSASLTVLDSGDVGIGLTNPTRELEVYRTGASVIAIKSNTAGLSQLALGDTDDDNYAQLILDNASNKLQIQNGGGGVVSDRGITLDSSENVGINKDSPLDALHVTGVIRTQMDGNNNKYIRLFGGNSGNFLDSYGNTLYIRPSGTTATATTIDPSGNVGIGANLTVAGNLTVNGTQTVLNTSTLSVDDLNITIADGAANAAAANGAGITVDGANATLTYTSAQDEWNFNKNLVVGGKETTASFPLMVKSNTAHQGLHIEENSGAESWQMGVDVDGDLNFYNSGSTTPSITFDDSNNVGIGKTNPGVALDVVGQINATGHVFSSSDVYAGGNTFIFGTTVSNGDYLQFETDKVKIYSGGTAGLTVKDGGNVGIGTDSPAGNLHVKSVGNIGDALLIVEADADNNVESDNPRIELRQDSNLVSGALYLEGNAGTTATNALQNSLLLDAKGGSSDGGTIQFATGGLAANQSGGPTNSAVRMTILRDGRVGIGTTSPTGSNLHIAEAGDPTILLEDTDSSNQVKIRYKTTTTEWTAGLHGGVDKWKIAKAAGFGTNDYLVVDASGRVGIGTDSPVAKLQVEELGIDTTETTTSATTQVTLASLSITDFRSARFTIQVTNSTDSTYHTTELLAVHDGTTAYITEFGEIHTGSAEEATFDATITSGFFRLQATPASTDTMVFKVISYAITV